MKSLNPFLNFLVAILLGIITQPTAFAQCPAINFLGNNLGNYLFIFTNGSDDANWQGASKGFAGNVVVDGIEANERTSGFVPYAGSIRTNDGTLSEWQEIIDDNAGQAVSILNQGALVTILQNDLESRFTLINGLAVTAGYDGISPESLNNLNIQNGMAQVIVINVTEDFSVSSRINIWGDKSDLFILRWDTDKNFSNGYNGKVKFSSGGAIIPQGGLSPANFIHVAGDINSSGGGNTPPPPFPQGPRLNNGIGALINGGSDFHGGGFFTGYWLTTGAPTITGSGQPYGKTSSQSNAIFVGGWYSKTTKFSMTSGTSGVYVNPCNEPMEGGFAIYETPKEAVFENSIIPEQIKVEGENGSIVIKTWPNPSDNQFTMDLDSKSDEKVVIQIYDMMGRLVLSVEGKGGERIQFGEELIKGIYSANVRQGSTLNTVMLVKHSGL